MKKRIMKLLCMFLCFAFLFTMFAGCGSGNGGNTGNTAQASSSEAKGASGNSTEAGQASSEGQTLTLPIMGAETVTLTVGTFDNWYAPASYASNLPVFQEVEKRTGVKIKWEVGPVAQWGTQMQTRLAAGGDDLPDIISIPDDPMKQANAGNIIPMEELIAKYAPDITRLFNENPDVKSLSYAPDGHIYSLSTVVSGSTYVNPCAFMIREDWLTKLGLAIPETTDQWYEVLKAFKTMDPNGNEKDDEIPFTSDGFPSVGRFANAWGLHPSFSGYFYADNSGRMQCEFISDRFKEFLAWVKKLYDEKLIDPEFPSNDYEKVVTKINRNMVGTVNNFISNIPSYNSNLVKAGFTDAHYIGVIPPKGPFGDQFVEGYGPTSGNYAITKASKHPEIAIQWLDYIYAHPEGIDLCMFGVNGKSYTVDNGQKKMTDFVLKNPDGLGPWEALRSLGAWPNVPYVQTEEAYRALFAEYPDILKASEISKPFIKPQRPATLATLEEAEQINALSADLNTYRDEMILKFILGKESLDKYDQYVKKLKDMGVDQLTEIYQKQWDRYSEKLK